MNIETRLTLEKEHLKRLRESASASRSSRGTIDTRHQQAIRVQKQIIESLHREQRRGTR